MDKPDESDKLHPNNEKNKFSSNSNADNNPSSSDSSGIILRPRHNKDYPFDMYNIVEEPSNTQSNPYLVDEIDSSANQLINTNKTDDEAEYIGSEEDYDRAKSSISFFGGHLRNVNDILKLECPLYRCSRNTIVLDKSLHKSSLFKSQSQFESVLQNRGSNQQSIRINRATPDLDRKHVHSSKSVLQFPPQTNRLMDIERGNTLQLKTFNSLLMTIFEIINCIIRYTVVEFPFIVKTLGLVYGPLIIAFIGAMSIVSIHMLIKVKQSTGESSYYSFAEKWWGLSGKIFLLILNCLSSFGSCLTYILMFLKIIPKLVSIEVGDFFISDEKVLSIILGLWLLIYCYSKEISGIKAAAYWGMLGILFFLLLNLANLLYLTWIENVDENMNLNFISPDWNNYDVWSSISTIILSFSFHTYAFAIYDCMDTPEPKKMIITSSIGIFVSMLIYLLIGAIGYIHYGEKISDYILDSIGLGSIGVLENISFIINVVMSFPLTFISMKHYLMFVIEITVTLIRDKCRCKSKRQYRKEREGQLIEETEEEVKNKSTPVKSNTNNSSPIGRDELQLVHIPEYIEHIIMFFVFLLVFFTANTNPDMKTIFGFLGSTTANLFSFILPALFYIKFSPHKLYSWKNLIAYSFVFLGTFGLVVCLYNNILSISHLIAHQVNLIQYK